MNDSDTVIYVSIAGAAALNTGIRINANGGSFEMSQEMGNLATTEITAIHGDAGTKRLLVVEGE